MKTVSVGSMVVLVMALCLWGTTGWANQVANGGFETGTISCGGTAPTSWTGYGTPPYKKTQASGCPASADNGPHSGSAWAGENASWGTKSGGMFQQLAVPNGASGVFQVYFQTYDSSSGGSPSTNVRARLGYDLNGGTSSANATWTQYSSTSNDWQLLQTPTITSTLQVVTLFIDYQLGPYGLADSRVLFDDASVTGGLIEIPPEGEPPTITNLAPANSSPLSLGNQLINYKIVDNQNDQAAITADYRMGDTFDSELSVPSHFLFEFGGSNGPCTNTGGIGSGAWKITGNDELSWWPGSGATFGTPNQSHPVAVMVDRMFGAANEQLTAEIKIQYWKRTQAWMKPPADREGVGLFLANSDYSDWIFVGGFDDIGEGDPGNAIEIKGVYDISGANPSTYESPALGNLEPELPSSWTDPTEVARANFSIRFRVVRSAGSIDLYWALKTNDFAHCGGVDPTGTSLDIGNAVKIGVFVNDDVQVGIDQFVTDWAGCSDGTGGDGKTGLSSSPSPGTSHAYGWDMGADLGSHPGYNSALKTQVRMSGQDDNGAGAITESSWFTVTTGGQQATNTPTNTPTTAQQISPTPTGGCPCDFHTADRNHDWQIDFSVALLLVSRFNTNGGAYSCGSQADGYQPGAGDHSCGPHKTDYNGNWVLDFQEMLRFIQFFNMGYHCQTGTVDCYAAGPPSKRAGIGVDLAAVNASRSVGNYTPGQNLTINVTITFDQALSSLGMIDTLPSGWTYVSASGTNVPDMKRQQGQEVQFLWSQPPATGPMTFSYVVSVPAQESGAKTLTGHLEYTVGTGNPETTNLPDSNVSGPVSQVASGVRAIDNNCYTAGQNLTINVTISYSQALSSLGMIDTLPSGWTYVSASGTNVPDMKRQQGAEVQFLWSQPPGTGPVTFSYVVSVPAQEAGNKSITGHLEFTVGTGNPDTGAVTDSALTVCPSGPTPTNTPIVTNPSVSGSRAITDNCYTAGQNLTVNVTITYTQALSSLGMLDTLPAGWNYVSASGANVPDMKRQQGQEVQFLWSQPPPTGPVTFSYVVSVPAQETGNKSISGHLEFTIGTGNPENGGVPDSALSNVCGPTPTNTPLPVSTAVTGERAVTGDCYTAGQNITVNVTIEFSQALSSLGMLDTLPAGWNYVSASGANVPDMKRQQGQEVQFLWSQPPATGPMTFSYVVSVPAQETGEKTISGHFEFTIGTGNPENGALEDSQIDVCGVEPMTPTSTPTVVVDTPTNTPTTPADTPTNTPPTPNTPTNTPTTPAVVNTPTPEITYIPGDINKDGRVNQADLLILQGNWHHGEPTPTP